MFNMAARLIRIMTWNANGLLSHKNELEAVLETEKIDICLVSETHFTKESYVKFKNFSTYHTIHPSNNARGGSAVLIRNNIQHHEEQNICTDKFQITNVSIKTKQQYFTVGAIYSPPRHTITADDYKQLLQSYKSKCILGGDFNAKHTMWGSRLITTKGRALSNALHEEKWDVVSTGKPTYWPTDENKLPDLIDFFIVNKISRNYISVEEGLDLSSDHSPVYLTVSDDIIMKEANPFLTTRSTSWEIFESKLDENLGENINIETQDDLELESIKFVKAIQKAAWESTRQTKRKQFGINFPREVRYLIAQKRKLRKKWHETRSPNDKRILNNACQQLKRLLRDFKSVTLNSYISNLNTDRSSGYSLWKCTKQLKRPIKHTPPIKKTDGLWARSAQDIADVFAEAFSKTFTLDDSSTPTSSSLNLNEHAINNHTLSPVSVDEVTNVIKTQLKDKKAPGFDLITAEILKKLTDNAIIGSLGSTLHM